MRHVTMLTAALGAAALSACQGKVSPEQQPGGAAQSVSVKVTPSQTTVPPGGTTQLAATVYGTLNTDVTWSVLETGDAGFVTTTGRYTAPTASTGTFHVRARSVFDEDVHGDATINVERPTCTSFTYSAWSACASGQQTRTVVSASPAGCTGGSPVLTQSCTSASVTIDAPKTITMDACTSHTFTATVTGAGNTAVTWRVLEASGGTVTQTGGVYTAPSTAATYHVVATSVADGNATDTATITVQDHVLSVAVSPASVNLTPGQTQQFTATITTTCGLVQATSTYTAPQIVTP